MNGYEYEYEYVVLRLNGVVWSGELGFIPVRLWPSLAFSMTPRKPVMIPQAGIGV